MIFIFIFLLFLLFSIIPVLIIWYRNEVNAGQPGVNVDPHIIKSLYKVNRVGRSAKSSLAVAEFEEAYFYPTDPILFEKKYGLPLQNVSKIIGPNHPDSGYLGEATLDVEYIIGVATNVSAWVSFISPSPLFSLFFVFVLFNFLAIRCSLLESKDSTWSRGPARFYPHLMRQKCIQSAGVVVYV
jgi:hypothetical protein